LIPELFRDVTTLIINSLKGNKIKQLKPWLLPPVLIGGLDGACGRCGSPSPVLLDLALVATVLSLVAGSC